MSDINGKKENNGNDDNLNTNQKEKENTALPIKDDGFSGDNPEQQKQLENELEDIAKVFKQELKKASDEISNQDDTGNDNSEDLSGSDEKLNPNEAESLDENMPAQDIPEEDLCLCCGERARDYEISPDYEYCSDCREAMKNHPIPIWSRLVFVLTILFSFFALGYFILIFEPFAVSVSADTALKQGKIDTALATYDSAISAYKALEQELNSGAAQTSQTALININPRFIAAKFLDTLFMSGYINDIPTFALEYFPGSQLDSFINYKAAKTYNISNELSSAMQSAYGVINEYSELPPEEIPYSEVIEKLDELATQWQEDEYTVYRDIALNIYRYYIAYLSDKDLDTQILPLEEIRTAKPDFYWVYGYNLALSYAKSGNTQKALDLVDEIKKFNTEDNTPYSVEACAHRVNRDYDKAIEAANKGLELSDAYFQELKRQKAIAYLLKGEEDNAYDLMREIYDLYIENGYEGYLAGEIGDTFAIAALESGNNDALDELKSVYVQNSIEFGNVLKAYLNGEIVVEQIFLEGKADVI